MATRLLVIMTRPIVRAATIVAVAFCLVSLLWMSPAAAHETEEPYLYVFVTEDGVDGRAELAVDDVRSVLGIGTGDDDEMVEADLRANAVRLRAYLADHLSIGADGEDWPIEFGRVDLFREGAGGLAFAVVQFQVDRQVEIPAELEVRFDPFYGEISGRNGLLLLSGGFEAGEFSPNKEILVAFDADNARQDIDLGGRGAWGNVRSSITLGVDHIKTGPDHILFVLALMLPAVLVFRERWRPIDGFGSALWRVLKIATMFTAAHSITFTAAGMGWLPSPPSKVTESIIAISIAAAALHNIRPIFPNREWSLSFVFGLFHGMGFASLVSDLDVSRSSQLLSLLGRNIGIEIGQVVVILLLFPALYLLRQTPIYSWVLTIGSLVLAALALLWTVERVFEVTLGTDDLVDQFAAVPRAYWIAAGVTAVALAANRYFADRDQLEPAVSSAAPR